MWELPKELGMDLQVGMDRERPVVIPKRGGGERESQDGDSFDSGDEKDLKGGVGNRNSTGGGNGATTTEDTTNVLASDAVIAAAQADSQGRRRFGIFGRRRNNRSNDIEAGMNSIELQNTNTAGGGLATETTPDEEAKKAADEDGIRVLIRLEGLDMDGKVLTNANAQLNHILVTGALVGAAVAVGETAVVVEGGGDVATVPVVETEKVEEDKPEEDGDAGKKWVWMVKVVRREALVSLGLHCPHDVVKVLIMSWLPHLIRSAPTPSSSKKFTVFLLPPGWKKIPLNRSIHLPIRLPAINTNTKMPTLRPPTNVLSA